MAELGKAYLTLLVETKDMKRSVQSAMKELGQEVGKSTSKSSNKLLSGVGGAIAKTAKIGAVGIAGLGAAVVGLAAKGGISRALAIEDSRAKLDGLGHSAKGVDKIMGDALASVKGTAFGLGEAASAAASAVASGVKPGKDLQRTLKLTGDAATIAGTSFGDMSAIFNKAAATNKVQGDILAQLGDQGIPIVQLLGKTMNKTSDDIYSMSKKGQISFEDLQVAIESGMGGAALKSGKTFRGAWANVMAALGRGGETVIKPVLDLLRDGFNKAIPIIDNVTNALKPFIANLVAKLPDVIESIKASFVTLGGIISTKIVPAVQSAATWFRDNKNTLLGLIPVVATAAGGFIAYFAVTKAMAGYKAIHAWYAATTFAQKGLNGAMKANPIGLVITAITALVAGLVWLYQNNETTRRIINTAWTAIKGYFTIAGKIIGAVMTGIGNFVKNVLGPAFVWFRDKVIKPVWSFIQTAIGNHWSNIKIVFTAIHDFLRRTLGPVFTWLRDSVIAPVFSGIRSAVSGAWTFVKPIFSAIGNFLRRTLGPAFTWFRDSVIKPVWDMIAGNISTVWNKMIRPVFDVLMNVIKGDMPAAFEAGKKAIASIWQGIKEIARRPVVAIVDVVYNNGLKALFNGISKKLGLSWELPHINVPAFAKGGQMRKGWKLVGEEGPELINTGPGHVYTAQQTKQMLDGKQQAPMGALDTLSGASPRDARLANGGWSDIWGGVKAAFGGVKDWVVGKIGQAVRALVEPIKGLVGGVLPGAGINELLRGGTFKLIDDMTSWAVKKDDAAAADGEGFAGSYDGALGRFYRPSNGPITSRYGPRWGSFHAGTDIAGGGKTFAALNGIVKYIGWGGGLPGRTGVGIRLDHGGGFQTYYGHNPVGGPQVKVGQQVKGGQHIGYQGATGNVTGVHLHFETLKNGRPVNPETYLHDNGGWHAPGTMSFNGLKKPEAILTPSEWDTADAALKLASARGGDRNIDMSGSHFGYDPDEVIRLMKREEERAQLMAGLT